MMKNGRTFCSYLDYLLAPTITLNCISHLRELIQEHHETFKDLYPSCTIIPRMHCMIHYKEVHRIHIIEKLPVYVNFDFVKLQSCYIRYREFIAIYGESIYGTSL